MDTLGMMDWMMAALFVGCGLYALYSYALQRKKDAVLENKLICPTDCAPGKCKQPKAFTTFILPKVLLLGVGLIVLGGAVALDHFFGGNNTWITLLLTILPLALLAWYALTLRKASKRFW